MIGILLTLDNDCDIASHCVADFGFDLVLDLEFGCDTDVRFVCGVALGFDLAVDFDSDITFECWL